jgi:UrcA family protein
MYRAISAAVISAIVLVAARPATAEEAAMPTQIVSLAGIDVSTERGADQLLRRIRHAARNVCAVGSGIQPRAEIVVQQACLHETMARTVAQIDNPVLTARFDGRSAAVVASR